MEETHDWDALLQALPKPYRARLTLLLRRSLKHEQEAQRAKLYEVPAVVRSRAVGTWRAQHKEEYSKRQLRRMTYERLAHDADFQQLEQELMAAWLKNHPKPESPELPDPHTMSFAEVCEAYREFGAALQGSSHAEVLREAYNSACSAVSQELYEELLGELCEHVRKADLANVSIRSLGDEVWPARRRGHFHRHPWPDKRTRSSQRRGSFNLYGVTSFDEVVERVQESRLALELLPELLGTHDTILELRARVSERAAARSLLAALTQLFEALHGETGLSQRALVRRAGKAASDIVRRFDMQGAPKLAEALLENPRYGAQYRWSIELELRVRESVPATPMDAYPLARTLQRHFVVHVGSTNSGKTYDSLQALMAAESGVYLGPLRLLAFEQYERMNSEGCPCTLLTGEERVDVPGARHVCSTVEMANFHQRIDVAIIDEAQMMADPDRGHRWTAAILGIPAQEVHVCCAPHAKRIVCKLIETCGDTFEVVSHERLTALKCEHRVCYVPNDVQAGDALIVFSRKSVHAVAAELAESGLRPSLVYGALPHDVRHEEARRFDAGETDVVVATDAIGMGMNLPIRRIVFVEQKKFDGHDLRPLKAEEVQQIAGRAGRYGRYNVGYFASTARVGTIERLYQSRVADIKTLPVGIPEDIALVRDAQLSEAIERWMALPLPDPFVRINAERDLSLIRDIERRLSEADLRRIEVKTKVLALAGMPFDEFDGQLRAVWSAMVDAELAGTEATFELPPAPDVGDKLDELEARYRLCDLLYCYARTFEHPAHVDDLTSRRNEISHAIMAMLARATQV